MITTVCGGCVAPGRDVDGPRQALKSGLKLTLGMSCPNGCRRSSVESADRHTVFTDRSSGDSRFSKRSFVDAVVIFS